METKKNKWPEITALIESYLKERNPEKFGDTIRKALHMIANTPESHSYFREYLSEENIVDKNTFDKFIAQNFPDFQPLYDSDLKRINPALDFERSSGMALLTTEIPARKKFVYKEYETFVKTFAPTLITSRGTVRECSESELEKMGLRARTVPSQALSRWHPRDIRKYLERMNKDLPPAVNPALIFDDIRSAFADYIYFQSPVIYDFMSIYVISTYFYQLFQAFPLLVLYGPTESGKSMVMQIIEYLAFNAMMVTDPTPAVIFRAIEEFGPTLLMDEIEGLASRREYASSIMSILRASYKRIDVPRMEEKKEGGFGLRLFRCYGPKVIGTIQGIENVLSNRSVVINLVRRRSEDDDKFERTDPAMKGELWRQLRNRLYLLLMTRWQELDSFIEPTVNELEGALSNRQLELWTPLLSIANWIDHTTENRGRTLFSNLLEMAWQKSYERQMIDSHGNQTLMMLQALLQLVDTGRKEPWYSTHEIKEQLEKFYAEPQSWINEVWIGRIMSQIGIIRSRRQKCKTEFLGEKRLTHYRIEPEWLKDYCERYGVNSEKEKDG